MDCRERDKLKAEILRMLDDIADSSDMLRNALSCEQQVSFSHLDADLEKAVAGTKQAFASLARHRQEHQC